MPKSERPGLTFWIGRTLPTTKEKATEIKMERFVIVSCCNGWVLNFFICSLAQGNFPAHQNSISGGKKNADRKYEILETQASTHVLPASISSNDLDPTLIPASEMPLVDKSNERRNAFSTESQETSGRRFSPPPTGFQPPRLLPSHNQEFRNREESRLKQLGVPLQQQSRFPQAAASTQVTKKPVVRTFDPDKNFKAFEHILQPGKKATHKDYDFSRYFTNKQGEVTPAPAQRRQDARQPVAQQQNRFATARPVQRAQPTQRTFAPITQRTSAPVTQRTFAPVQRTAAPTQRPAPQTQRTAAPTQRTFPPTTTRKPTTTTRVPQTTTTRRTTQRPLQNNVQQFNQKQFVNNQQQLNRPSVPSANSVPFSKTSKPAVPARDLLPPIDATRNYENDATTKGPAIYYEWKVPERGLLPPKFGNETEDGHSKRSIDKEEGNFGVNNDVQRGEGRRLSDKSSSSKIEYKDLQRQFAIPQAQLPIENSGRDGYENAEALNSFQVKIPYKKDQSDRYYYLEHGHCNPECHPYFFKPGRCEPCIKL